MPFSGTTHRASSTFSATTMGENDNAVPSARLRMKAWCAPVAVFVGVLVVAVAVTTATVNIMHDDARDEAIASQRQHGGDIVAAGVSGALARVNAFPVMASTFMGRANRSHPMPQEQFEQVVVQFAKFGGDAPLLISLTMSPYVNHTERAAFEASAGVPLQRWAVFNPRDLSAGVKEVYPPAPYYFNVRLVWPNSVRLRYLLDADITVVNPNRLAAINQAVELGVPVAGGAISNTFGVIIPFQQAIPTSNPALRPVDGIVMFQVLMSAFSTLFGDVDERAGTLYVSCRDVTNAASPFTLFDEAAAADVDEAELMLLTAQTFVVAQRTWEARVSTRSALVEEMADADTPTVALWLGGMAIGLVVGALLAVQVVVIRQRRVAEVNALQGRTAAAVHLGMLRLMNHEMRNPLTVVRANVDFVKDDIELLREEASVPQPLLSGLSDEAESIAAAAATMQRALDAMLDINRVRAGDLALSVEPFQPTSVLRDVRHYVAVYTSQLFRPTIHVEKAVPSWLMGDKQRLRQVLVGLAYHLHEYSVDGCLQVDVSWHADSTALVFAISGFNGLPTHPNTNWLQVGDDPSEQEQQLRDAGWSPPAFASTEGNSSRVAPALASVHSRTSGASGGTSMRQQSGSATACLEVFDIGICTKVIRGMGGAIWFWTADAGNALVVAIPCERANNAPVCMDSPRPTSESGFLSASSTGPDNHSFVLGPPATASFAASDPGAVDAQSIDNAVVIAIASSSTVGDTAAPHGENGGDATGNPPSHRVTITVADEGGTTDDVGASHAAASTHAKVGAGAGPDADDAKADDAKADAGAGADADAGPDADGSASLAAGAGTAAAGAIGVATDVGDGNAGAVGATPAPASAGDGSAAPGEPQAITRSLTAEESKETVGALPSPAGKRKPRRRRPKAKGRGAASRAEQAAEVTESGPHSAVVVDDEKMIRAVVSRQMKRMSVPLVGTLEDGDMLLECLNGLAEPPTCVLLDIVMRRSDGVEVLIELRTQEKWKDLPVYAMTSNVEALERYKEVGFNGLIGKPFDRAALRKMLVHSAAVRRSEKAGAEFLVVVKHV